MKTSPMISKIDRKKPGGDFEFQTSLKTNAAKGKAPKWFKSLTRVGDPVFIWVKDSAFILFENEI